MINSKIAISFVLVLAGCASDYQRCLNRVGAELSSLQDGIAVVEGNLNRGYAVFRTQVPYTVEKTCVNGTVTYSCPETAYRTQETPVAIDVGLERTKLSNLRSQLKTAQRRYNANVTSCEGLDDS
jgi:hypothetical protein